MSKKNKHTPENEAVASSQPQVIIKKKGCFLGKLVALVLGFILGAISMVGGIVGLGVYVGTRPIKEVNDKANDVVPNLNLDLSQYLTKEYYEGTVLQLFSGLGEAVSELSSGKGGFSSLAKISPKVEDAVAGISKKFVELGSTLSEEAITADLLDTPFSELGAFFSEKLLASVEIGTLLTASGSFSYETLTNDPLMMSLFFGEEGKDYLLDGENQQILPVEGGTPFLTVGNIFNDGITATIENIALDALFTVNEEDSVMTAIAYGNANRFRYVDKTDEQGNVIYDENGTPLRVVEMQPLVYVRKTDGSFYLDEQALDCTATPIDGKTDEYLLTFSDGATQYVKRQTAKSTEEKFDVYLSADTTKLARYPKTTLKTLMNDPQGMLETVQIASVLRIDVANDPNPILVTLAYGIEGEDFDYVMQDGVKTLVMREGKTPKTLGQLTGNAFDGLLSDLPLDAIMTVNLEDGMISALVYGPKTHWTLVTENGESFAKMNAVAYAFDGENFVDVDGNTLTIDETQTTVNGDITTIAVNVAKEGADPVYEMRYLKKTGEKYLQYKTQECKDGEEVTYKKTTVGDLQNDPSKLINRIELGEVFGVSPLDENPDRLMLALSYGNNGTHYEIVNGTLRWLNGNKPRTIGDLRGENASKLFKDVTIADVLNVENTESEDPMKKALAFSKDGKAYTIGELSDNPTDIIYNIHLDSIIAPETGKPMTLYILYGKQDLHFAVVDSDPTLSDENPDNDGTGTKITNPDNPNKQFWVKMLQRQNAVHENSDGTLCLHNEYGEEITDDENLKYFTNAEQNPAYIYDESRGKYKDETGKYYIFYEYTRHQTLHRLVEPVRESDRPGDIRMKGKNSLDETSEAFYVQVYQNGNWVSEYYEHNTVADLTGDSIMLHFTSRLTLHEVLQSESEGNVILQHLDHYTVDELPKAIDNLTIAQVFEKDVYITVPSLSGLTTFLAPNGVTSYHVQTDEKGNYYLYNSEKVRSGAFIDRTGKPVEGEDRVLTGTWHYLLTDPNGEKSPEDYTVVEISALVNNMTTNVQNASLNELHANGLINTADSLRNTALIPAISMLDPTAFAGKTTLGELTVTQITRYLELIIVAYDRLI